MWIPPNTAIELRIYPLAKKPVGRVSITTTAKGVQLQKILYGTKIVIPFISPSKELIRNRRLIMTQANISPEVPWLIELKNPGNQRARVTIDLDD